MTLVLLAIGVLVATGVAALPVRCGTRAGTVTAAGAVGAATLVVGPALRAMLGASLPGIKRVWSVPLGTFSLGIDALTGVFLLIIVTIGALGAVYGVPYLTRTAPGRRLGVPWCMYNLLLASMLVVVTARDGVLFLVAWEVMSLASFFLVTFDDRTEEVREAGWTYLLATHIGTAFLLAMFLLIAEGGPLSLEAQVVRPTPLASVAFVLALVGFGTKAGFWPLHVWLPQAHPAAPSHVSAVMSGVMLKMGVYGLLRVLPLLGPPAVWWGWVLVGVGAVSGVGGVLFALAQHDLKRLLAYHSVENLGLIALGLGLGTLGLASNLPVMAALGFAGALLHVVNHAIFKSLLFFGAGAVVAATGTRDLDQLAGLGRRMPVTARTFLVGSAAISGLPPLNGFVSELLIFLAALAGISERTAGVVAPAAAVLAALGLIGGLAAACFAKAYGVSFLGEPRQPLAAHDPAPPMRRVMVLLAALCALIGLGGAWVVPGLTAAVATLVRVPFLELQPVLGGDVGRILAAVGALGAFFWVLVLVLLRLRKAVLGEREVGASPTWDCGYAAPSPRMQYTASSFAQPLVELFRGVLHTHHDVAPPHGIFPRTARLATETPEVVEVGFLRPLFAAIARLAQRLHVLQHGRVQLYVLYLALALLALLVWQLGGGW
ncbi:MAG: hypothetical protein KA072_02630 [Thermoanaerobaculaceae bacterium]|nr:hypothetical protein [Thermoanaerobaculaceae bacterium]MDI9620498.1 proton-conducting transporter membrane subunit [Acidobacteriota bacterium]NLH12708.1 hypothetical protein [Holophagae bacterium]HPW56256.1 proton-conducting transporter membrane subunit [Thermoanaerobaculaceae bacterium]